MTKSELIDALAERRNLSRRVAEEVVNIIFDQMKSTLMDGGRIEIRGFGSFKVEEYEGYIGRNPRTRQQIMVPAKRLPKFKTSKLLHARLNAGLEGG